MHDEDDIHEPEHDHLLDHEFHDDDERETQADPMFDDVEDEDEEYGLDVLDDEDHEDW
ncbi:MULTISPECIES: hypothetical protein [unclassified Pseudomonas]|uniref:hypothetical protein n=1 Tax=unclassified Pseudomonas TaxID=196821 RepID=UPI0015AD9EA6|nr:MULTISPECIES: hypothetical protein [unclassified Pseudomonas]MCU1719720.1 hypothetical protein [Pseudomonas sp. 5P_5.1_Bac1]